MLDTESIAGAMDHRCQAPTNSWMLKTVSKALAMNNKYLETFVASQYFFEQKIPLLNFSLSSFSFWSEAGRRLGSYSWYVIPARAGQLSGINSSQNSAVVKLLFSQLNCFDFDRRFFQLLNVVKFSWPGFVSQETWCLSKCSAKRDLLTEKRIQEREFDFELMSELTMKNPPYGILGASETHSVRPVVELSPRQNEPARWQAKVSFLQFYLTEKMRYEGEGR